MHLRNTRNIHKVCLKLCHVVKEIVARGNQVWPISFRRKQEHYRRKVVGQIQCIVLLHVVALHWNRTILHELLEVRKKNCENCNYCKMFWHHNIEKCTVTKDGTVCLTSFILCGAGTLKPGKSTSFVTS